MARLDFLASREVPSVVCAMTIAGQQIDGSKNGSVGDAGRRILDAAKGRVMRKNK